MQPSHSKKNIPGPELPICSHALACTNIQHNGTSFSPQCSAVATQHGRSLQPSAATLWQRCHNHTFDLFLGRLPLTSVKHRPSVVFLFNGLHWPYPRDCRYQFVDEADELMVVGTANTLRTNAHALLVLRQRDAILWRVCSYPNDHIAVVHSWHL
jgi:hypothetical protein